jgi:hypothetical protein
MISAWLLIAAPLRPSRATRKRRTNKLPARASVLHARSLLASKQDSTIYIQVFARWSLARGPTPHRSTLHIRNAPTDYEQCAAKHCLRANLNFAFWFLRIVGLRDKLLKLLMAAWNVLFKTRWFGVSSMKIVFIPYINIVYRWISL